MAWIGNYVYNSLFGGISVEGGYEPSVSDVLTIKTVLHKKTTLPYELIDVIVDLAEYWPHTTTTTSHETRVTTARSQDRSKFILRSYPLAYIPSVHNTPDQVENMAIKSPDAYTTECPKPWSESRQFPAESTQEVLSTWQEKSLAKSVHPCRKIVFTLKSHDQGWGGRPKHDGDYEGSYSWFEAGLERMTAYREKLLEHLHVTENDTTAELMDETPCPKFELNSKLQSISSEPLAPLVCNLRTIIPSTAPRRDLKSDDTFLHDNFGISHNLTIQRNVVASKQSKVHKVTWSCNDKVVPDSLDALELGKQGRGKDSADGDFVNNMRVGDVVTIWAHARFPGWVNFVEEATIDVYWAV